MELPPKILMIESFRGIRYVTMHVASTVIYNYVRGTIRGGLLTLENSEAPQNISRYNYDYDENIHSTIDLSMIYCLCNFGLSQCVHC